MKLIIQIPCFNEEGNVLPLLGELVPVRAKVRSVQSLSAHADADELTIWTSRAAETPQQVFVTHGEEAARQALAGRLAERYGWSCTVPALEDTVRL